MELICILLLSLCFVYLNYDDTLYTYRQFINRIKGNKTVTD